MKSKITEKTRYKDSLSISYLITYARNKYGKGIYKFRVNDDGKVKDIATGDYVIFRKCEGIDNMVMIIKR